MVIASYCMATSTYLRVSDTKAQLGKPAALLRFDFDLNLRAAESVKHAEPHWPVFRALAPGRFSFTYSYNDQKIVVLETTNDNWESENSCGLLPKANYSVIKSNYIARPITVASSPLTSITVTDANRTTNEDETDFGLAPLDFKAIPCSVRP